MLANKVYGRGERCVQVVVNLENPKRGFLFVRALAIQALHSTLR